MKHIIILITAMVISITSFSQEANVAYKVANYDFKYSHNLKIKTNCEMAELIFSKGGGDKIEIKCTYSAKHADKSIATKELQRHSIRVRKTLNEIFISNYFTISGGENEPKAKLKIKFEITIPDSVNLDIQNNFGSCKFINVNAKGNLNQDFGKIDITNMNGNLKIKGNLTEVTISKFTGGLDIRNKSGDINTTDIKGSLLFIQNSNANIALNNIDNTVNVKLQLSNCQLTCKNINYAKHSLSIESYKTPILQNANLTVEKKGEYYYINSLKALPGFIIKASHSTIHL
ncbi:MAG TPA: hypothetical protein PLU10_04530 [Chitinophagaceae bacterium]|nr:hypothetical protein [Chitinophagaceae bacterium]